MNLNKFFITKNNDLSYELNSETTEEDVLFKKIKIDDKIIFTKYNSET